MLRIRSGYFWNDRNEWKLVRLVNIFFGVGRLSRLVQLVDDDSVLFLEMIHQLLSVTKTDATLLTNMGQLSQMHAKNMIAQDRNPAKLLRASCTHQSVLLGIIRMLLLQVDL